MDYAKESLRLHNEWKGKIEVIATVPVKTKDDLSLAYTPGVAQPCLEIQKDVDKSYDLTRRHNLCAVITDGSAVLGLGDIGPEAGMPVMEGKCVLFKSFGGVDAFPLCVKTHDVDEFVNTVYLISGSFGGINLEDISAPRCFEIERKLKEKCDIPIFHDDQHGTAVITLAGLSNALKVVGKKKEDIRVVMSGAGAAAISICRLLLSAGIKNVTLCDRTGAIYKGREKGMNWIKEEMAEITNLDRREGSLADMLVGADVFIGVSGPNCVTPEMIKSMNEKSIVFPLANPVPEINPVLAKEWHPTKNGSLLPCTHHASGYLFFKKKTALTLAASSLMNFSGGGDGDGDISKAIYLSSMVLSCLLWLVYFNFLHLSTIFLFLIG